MTRTINIVVESQPGIGTIADMREELAARGSRYTIVSGAISAVDFRADLSAIGHDGGTRIDEADTLIVVDVSHLDPMSHDLVQELLIQRSLHGQELPELKTVILVVETVNFAATMATFDLAPERHMLDYIKK